MQKAVINASKSCFSVIIRHFHFAKVLRKYWSRFKRKRNLDCLILNFIRKKLYSNIPLFQTLKNQSYLKERFLSTSYYLRAHDPWVHMDQSFNYHYSLLFLLPSSTCESKQSWHSINGNLQLGKRLNKTDKVQVIL